MPDKVKRSDGRPALQNVVRGAVGLAGRLLSRDVNFQPKTGGLATYQVFRLAHDRLGHFHQPDYTVVESQFFPTVSHPRGWSDRPEYELGSDGKIYRSTAHPLGAGNLPDYEFGPDGLIYRTPHHPEGGAVSPEYALQDVTG